MVKKRRSSKKTSKPVKRRVTAVSNIEPDVGLKNGRGTRSVFCRLGEVELEDSFNTSKLAERKSYVKEFAKEAGVTIEKVQYLVKRIAQRARLVDEAIRKQQAASRELQRENGACGPYRIVEGGIVYDKPDGEDIVTVPLTNFVARIVEDISEDDGDEVRRVFRIQAELAVGEFVFSVPADKFPLMFWPTEHLGARAVVLAGFGARDHARTAIQLLSNGVVRRTVYRHTGWREVDGVWAFLHADGAIGPNGPISGVEVALSGKLDKYILPAPPTKAELRRCVRETLRLRQLAPRKITCCLEGATFRAPLGNCDSTVWLAGKTGNGKSELIARYQQHYGPGMDRLNLPGAWLSTGNSLEAAAHAAKDVTFPIDDFAPTGTGGDVAKYHQQADRVIRSQRNKSGRERLRQDATTRPTKVPRCVIVATGEDIPNGVSLRASMMILTLWEGDLDWTLLTECQKIGADGIYAKAMAGYISWIARHYKQVHRDVAKDFAKLRDRVADSGSHRRTPELVSNLAIGVRYFLRFATNIGAISKVEYARLRDEAWQAIGEAAADQAEPVDNARPEHRYLELLGSAIASGEAHLAAANGNKPSDDESARAWGWRYVVTPSGSMWQPQGRRIGWLGPNGEVYLSPEASLKAAQEMARHGEGIAVGSKTLHKRLFEAGCLATTEREHGRLTVRRSLDGVLRRHVLHVRRQLLQI